MAVLRLSALYIDFFETGRSAQGLPVFAFQRGQLAYCCLTMPCAARHV